MAWRKIYLGDEIWEWKISKGMADNGVPRIVIHAPSRKVTTIPASEFRFKTAMVNCEICGPSHLVDSGIVAFTPGPIRAYIKLNRIALMAKPERRQKRERGK